MKEIQISRRAGDIAGAAIFIAISIGAFVITLSFLPPVLSGDPGAAFFPRLIVGVILLFSLVLLVQRLRKRPARSDEDASPSAEIRVDLSAFGVTVGSVLALIVAMASIGFEPAAFGFLFVLLGWRIGRWVWAAITSVIAVVILYLAFVALLKVQLPMLVLPKYIYF